MGNVLKRRFSTELTLFILKLEPNLKSSQRWSLCLPIFSATGSLREEGALELMVRGASRGASGRVLIGEGP